MVKVSNKSVIRSLSHKSYKQNIRRNLTAVLAIILTTVLFTSLFTVGMGIVKSVEYNSMRMAGGSAHGTLKYLSDEQFDILSKHPLIKQVGKSRFCGMAGSAKLLKRPVELNSKDKAAVKMNFIDIAGGRLPESADDIVLDTITLQMLGLKPEAGQSTALDVDFGDHSEKINFNICGWYEGDPAFAASIGLVSESFAQKYIPGRGQNPDEFKDTYGSSTAELMFRNSRGIEANIIQVIEDSGFSADEEVKNSIAYGVNWSYMSTDTEASLPAFAAISGALLLIMFTGYLIIYNIFQISVTKDVKFYGLLKTIGTTGKQIRRILISQALRMSITGIPLGLAAGFGVGALMLPLITAQMHGGKTSTSFSPVIFVGSAVFSLITVLISCSKPARTAAKISPVEAVRYSGVSNSIKKKSKKSTTGARPAKMALSNLGRNRKRTVIAIISMSLSLVLMNTVLGLSNCLDLDKYVSNFIDCDFQLAHASYFNLKYSEIDEENPISQSFIDSFKAQKGFADGGTIYTDYSKIIHSDYNGTISKSYGDLTFDDDYRMPVLVYGMDDFVLGNLKMVKGNYDKEKFASGDYLLLGLIDETEPLYEIGEKVRLNEMTKKYKNPAFDHYDMETAQYIDKDGKPMAVSDLDICEYNGKSKEYTVMGYYEMNSNNTCRRYGNYATFAMSSAEFFRWSGSPKAMTYLANVEDYAIDDYNAFVKQYTETVEPMMNYQSRDTFTSEFEQMKMMIIAIGSALCLVIAMIGLLNFTNSISTGIISRQKEFAMLQSIGMTRRQLRYMLCCEGLYYAVFTALLSLVMGVISSAFIVRLLCSMFWFTSYTFIILPVFIAIPILLILGIAVPSISYRAAGKHSIVERLRESE